MNVLPVRSKAPNVVTLVPMWNRLYAVSYLDGRVVARSVKRPERARQGRPGVVVPFPGR